MLLFQPEGVVPVLQLEGSKLCTKGMSIFQLDHTDLEGIFLRDPLLEQPCCWSNIFLQQEKSLESSEEIIDSHYSDAVQSRPITSPSL